MERPSLLVFIFGSILLTVMTTKLDSIEMEGKAEGSEEVGEDVSVDDRININVNRGYASAYGPGGVGASASLSHGVQVGIRRPGVFDQVLHENTNSYSQTSAFGPRPPSTYAGAQNQIRRGGISGGANAGFSGGQGIVQTDSMSQTVEIPLDPYGTVLYSNLEGNPSGQSSKGEPKKSSIQSLTSAQKYDKLSFV